MNGSDSLKGCEMSWPIEEWMGGIVTSFIRGGGVVHDVASQVQKKSYANKRLVGRTGGGGGGVLGGGPDPRSFTVLLLLLLVSRTPPPPPHTPFPKSCIPS